MSLNINPMILPENHPCRPGYAMRPDYITIHTTGNRSRGANALMHGRYMLNLDGSRMVSWHYTVDDSLIIQHLPDHESAWHAGDGNGAGNRNSIGVEICENVDGDLEEAVKMAILLIRKLQKRHGIPLRRIVPHKKWSGKNCPRPLLPVWDELIEKIGADSPVPRGSSYLGKRVESIHPGFLRFYTHPSWKDSDVAGTVKKGFGFPVITAKVKVEAGYQYRVKNSKGAIYYITASPEYVTVVDGR
ncbi:N-acetylmuramoyl-L-alanine amidase family protein [Thalassobacillus devorans]|uniref:peptidoglycan recognition protein family protein n=1 Tax=Thalassobacillus devorans TaxID=279813 RepID=UPI0004BCE483|nr:N-acetylmuramoyl-L-alanine amidase [Thalassobacillus devorans]